MNLLTEPIGVSHYLAVGAVMFVAGILGQTPDRRSWRPSPRTVLVLLLAAIVPVGAAIYSLVGSTVFTPRYLIPSWPALALAVGALITAGRGWPALLP